MENKIKKVLLKRVFEKAAEESSKKTKNSLAYYLSVCLEEQFKHSISERTLVRYYDFIILEKKSNYLIDNYNLNVFAKYLGYKDLQEFSEQLKKDFQKEKPLGGIIVESKFSPKYYIYIIGVILFALGAWQFLFSFKKENAAIFEKKNKNITIKPIETQSASLVASMKQKDIKAPKFLEKVQFKTTERKRECMYWNNDHYEEVFCDELIEGKPIVALNRELKHLKKINEPETLTVHNALGKVWYDKSNKKVEFFTHYGIHPENGKTLKPVSKYILEKYAKK